MTLAVVPRVELKYCVPEGHAAAALRVAAGFLEPDVDGGASQQIISVYLESPALTFLHWHLQRRPRRFKLRIRDYGADGAVVFAEVKHKSGDVTYKDRAAVPRTAVSALLADTPCGGPDPPALESFTERRRAFGAAPMVAIRVEREAYRGGPTRGLAVTVDRRLEVQPWSASQLPGRGERGWQTLTLPEPAHDAVIEIKHDGAPPLWMTLLMTRLAPWRRSMSKYVAAMAHARLDQGVVPCNSN